MEIHRYEKLWFGAALVLIVGFIATVVYGAAGVGISMVDDDGGTIDPNNISDHPKFEETGLREAETSNADYEASIIARRFIFQGALSDRPLEVPEDSTITFYITSPDVIHGFKIVDTNANTMVIPGQVTEMTVEFDDPGEYGIICSEFCGPGHENMAGQLTVVPQDDWSGIGGER
jgi:cytochrome c oxidase subunit 2